MVILALIAVVIILFVVLPLGAGLALSAIINAIVVGLVIGALGRLVIPGRQAIGLVATFCLGLIGAIVGRFIGHEIHINAILTTLVEIGVAAVLVACYAGWGDWGRRRLGGRRNRGYLGPPRTSRQ